MASKIYVAISEGVCPIVAYLDLPLSMNVSTISCVNWSSFSDIF